VSAVVEVRDFGRAFAVALPPAILLGWRVSPSWGAGALAVSALVVLVNRAAMRRRLRTASAVLASYREGDFSIRARVGESGALGEVLEELNALGERLRNERLGALEAWTLLRKVMAEVDVVVLAYDAKGKVRLANQAAATLLGQPAAALIGEEAFGELLAGDAPRVLKSVGDRAGDWELRRGTFRLQGEPHTLVVLSDMSSALRANERDAWRRLIRVMSHEINNSLAPIRSLSEGLRAQLEKPPPRPAAFEKGLDEGLGVIARRSEALSRFMGSYARLARLPPPTLAEVELGPIVEKVALLEQRVPPAVKPGPPVTLRADADQLEQAIINLIKNAVEATKGGVTISWTATPSAVDILVEDEGPGIESANVFVPFFTTKPEGSGIGLVLTREIVEAHKGQLTLTNRPDGKGAIARIRLPR
jgi:nitrogen fixation/metabolism regulation signal transduction histidine kinase